MQNKSLPYKKQQRMKVTNVSTAKINAVLPQTQCRECGFNGCEPYAEAMAKGEAEINLCPPGGVNTLHALSTLLQRDATPYVEELTTKYRPPSVAIIDENLCIGCVKCINACPVDAIVGAPKQMHTVITAECTGCELCIPACPMDCISMQPISKRSEIEQKEKSQQWRQRYDAHLERLMHNERVKQQQHNAAKLKQKNAQRNTKQAVIAAAIARSKAKRQDKDE